MTYKEFIKKDWLDRNFLDFTVRNVNGFDWLRYYGTDEHSKFLGNAQAVDIETAALVFSKQMISAIAPRPISITLEGDETYTDGHNTIVLSKEITKSFPRLSKYNVIDVYIGLSIHESAHILFTDNKLCLNAAKKVKNTDLFLLIHNIVEDERIENLVGMNNPGYSRYIAKAKSYFFNKNNLGVFDAKEDILKILSAFTYIIRYPSSTPENLFTEFEVILNEIISILTPYPKTNEEALEGTKKIYDLLVPMIKEVENKEEQEGESDSDSKWSKGKSGKSKGDDDSEESEKKDSEEEESGDSGDEEQEDEQEGEEEGGEGDDGEDEEKSDGDDEEEGDGSKDDAKEEPKEKKGAKGKEKSSKEENEPKEEKGDDGNKDTELTEEVKKAIADILDKFGVNETNEFTGSKQELDKLNSIISSLDLSPKLGTYELSAFPTVVNTPKSPSRSYDYRQSVAKVGQFSAYLRAVLSTLNKDDDYYEKELRSGDLDEDMLPDFLAGGSNIYEERTTIRNSGGAVILILDASGSIQTRQLKGVIRDIAVLFHRALHGLNNIEFYCYQHNAPGWGNEVLNMGILYEHGKTLEMDCVASYDNPMGSNRDGQAIIWAVDRVKSISELNRKVVFMVNDGEPSASVPVGYDTTTYTRKCVELVEKQHNTMVIQIPIYQAIRSELMYNDFIPFKDYPSLIDKIGEKIRKIIKTLQI